MATGALERPRSVCLVPGYVVTRLGCGGWASGDLASWTATAGSTATMLTAIGTAATGHPMHTELASCGARACARDALAPRCWRSSVRHGRLGPWSLGRLSLGSWLLACRALAPARSCALSHYAYHHTHGHDHSAGHTHTRVVRYGSDEERAALGSPPPKPTRHQRLGSWSS